MEEEKPLMKEEDDDGEEEEEEEEKDQPLVEKAEEANLDDLWRHGVVPRRKRTA